MKKRILIFGIIATFFWGKAQNIKLTKETESIIMQRCDLCVKNVPHDRIVAENNDMTYTQTQAQFHNFHVYLFNEDHEKAIVSSEKLTQTAHPFLGVVEYMQGYLFLRKRLLNDAAQYFQKSLLYDIDSTLQAHTRLNLAAIFQEKKNFAAH